MKRRGRGEGSIYKRSDGRWTGSIDLGWHDGKRQRKYLYGKTYAEVAAKVRDAHRVVDANLPLPDGRVTVKAFLDQWLQDEIEPSGLAESTKASYADNVRLHIDPALGHVRLGKLTTQQIQRFANTKRGSAGAHGKPLSDRSVVYLVAILRRALNDATRWGLLSRNPALGVRVTRPQSDATDRALTARELKCLLDVASGDPLYPMILLMGTTGMRKGEVLALRWSDVDLDGGTLRIERSLQRVPRKGLVTGPTKTHSSRRMLELSNQVVEALRAHRRQQVKQRFAARPDRWVEHELVFPSSVGTPLEPRNLNRSFGTLVAKAGIRPMRVHDLRHTAATIAFAAGIDTKAVQAMLGHSRLATTTDTYIGTPIALTRTIADRIAASVDTA